MKCICAVLLHKTSVRGKRNTLETNDSSWMYDGGSGESRKQQCVLSGESDNPQSYTGQVPSNCDCEVQLAVKVEQNRGFAGSLGIGVRQDCLASALLSSWTPVRTHHYTNRTFFHVKVS
jgi:hypothetical protein